MPVIRVARLTPSKNKVRYHSLQSLSVNTLHTIGSGLPASQFGYHGGVSVSGECVTLGPPPFFLPGNVRNELKDKNVPFRIGLNWTLVERTLFYATMSRGFRAGSSPAFGASNFNRLTPVTPEELLAYEVGVKSALFDRTVQLNASVFYYDYTDKQQLGRLQDP